VAELLFVHVVSSARCRKSPTLAKAGGCRAERCCRWSAFWRPGSHRRRDNVGEYSG
jgi:hypothetical protein